MFRRRKAEEAPEPIPDHEAYWWLADQVLDNVSDYVVLIKPNDGGPDFDVAKERLVSVAENLGLAREFGIVTEIESHELMNELIYQGSQAALSAYDTEAFAFFEDQQRDLMVSHIYPDVVRFM